MPTIDDQIEASSDDGNEIPAGAISLNASTVILGNAFFQISGMRFDTLLSPTNSLSGTTITDAFIQWRAHKTDTGSFISTMYAEDAVSPGTFTTTDFNISGRINTTASVADGSAELGNWTAGEDKTLTVTSLIQELADSYDPTAIVFISRTNSGNGEREAKSFNVDETLAPKLHITFTSAGGDAAIVAEGAAPATLAVSPNSTFLSSSIIVTEGAATATLAKSPNADITATSSGTIPAGVAPAINATSPNSDWIISSTFEASVATATPAKSPNASFVTGEAISFTPYGLIERSINRDDYPNNTVFFLEVIMLTTNSLNTIEAKLVNVTDTTDVVGSGVTTTSTSATRVRSGNFGISGTKTYRVDFGGIGGGVYKFYNATLIADWSV